MNNSAGKGPRLICQHIKYSAQIPPLTVTLKNFATATAHQQKETLQSRCRKKEASISLGVKSEGMKEPTYLELCQSSR